MFRYLLWAGLIGAPLTASAAETVWWRTTNAAVIQGDDACSLYFYTELQAAIFTWKADDSTTIALQDERFHFGSDEHFAVGVRIDDNYLPGDLEGIGNNNFVTVAVQQSIDNLLRRASAVQIKAAAKDYDVMVPLNKAKMPTLLTAVKKCRAVLKH